MSVGDVATVAQADELATYLEASAAAGSVGSWSSNVAKNITSLALPAGRWRVEGSAYWSGGAITGTVSAAKLSTTTASVGTGGDDGRGDTSLMPTAAVNITNHCPARKLDLTVATTLYLCGLITFSGGTPLAGGILKAWRI